MSTEYDPHAPAFNFKQDREQIMVEEPQEVIPATSEESVVEEKNRVPYSRFEKVYQSAQEAREEAERYRQEAESLRQSQTQTQEELPDYWVELFGDSPAAQKAYKAEQKRMAEIEMRAEQRALETIEQRQYQEQSKIATNLDTIDNRLDALADALGRDLSENEQIAILDIIDDYTPKDSSGKYAGELLPFDKAYEIYEMKQSQASAQTRRSRDNVASISGSKSQGETQPERNFSSGNWGSWRNRLK